MSVEANSSTLSFSLGGCFCAPVNICLSHKRANSQQTEAGRRHWKPAAATLWAFANSVRIPAAVMIWTLIGWNDRPVLHSSGSLMILQSFPCSKGKSCVKTKQLPNLSSVSSSAGQWQPSQSCTDALIDATDMHADCYTKPVLSLLFYWISNIFFCI